MGGKVSNAISESTHFKIHSTKVMCMLHGRVFLNVLKEFWDFNF